MTSGPPLIAHVIYSLGSGGLENGLVNIINRTPPERYRHVIICLTVAQEFAQRITAPDVEIVELHKKDGQDPGMYWRLLKLLRTMRPDILHSRNLAALEVQALGIFLPGIKQVHGEHGRDIYDLDGSNWKYRMLRKSMRFFVGHYIAVSQDLESWLLESIGVRRDRMSQIYNGVDHESFQPRQKCKPNVFPQEFLLSDTSLVIGTVGRLVEVKDQLLILKAVQLLLQDDSSRRHTIRIMLVGDGPLKDQLQQKVKALGLEDIVWMPGDRSDISKLLQAMDVFLLPSLAEGISNTILEAMATGLPVIATDVGGNPELIANGVNGYLVPVGDAQALAAAIGTLMEDRDLRQKIGLSALESVRKRFDWNKTVSEYLKVYDQLLGHSAG